MDSQKTAIDNQSVVDVATIYDTDDGATVVDDNSKSGSVASRSVMSAPDKSTIIDSVITTVPDEEEQTKNDGSNVDITPVQVKRMLTLKRFLTGEVVRITGNLFRIGRKDDGMDYVVLHNPAISRRHAEIFSREGRYYVRDLGAKNRTYVNGEILSVNGEIEISSGDIIRLANEDFLVQM